MHEETNIGIKERRFRRLLGISLLGITMVLTFILSRMDLNFWWGIILFPFWFQGIRFLYDYSTGTCPLKAELGQSRLNAFFSVFGEKIEDRELALKIRTKSRLAIYRAAAAAFLLTILSVILIAAF